ncbi:MAG TPA: hypothetical protein VFG68_13150 [Fimbriiglobus sp.]|nr:hypothetical protein [Fimbriiglobus sp.]
MATYPYIRKCYTVVLEYGHKKMLEEALTLLGFEEGDFTPEERKVIQAFDANPIVDVLVVAVGRKLGAKKPNATK